MKEATRSTSEDPSSLAKCSGDSFGQSNCFETSGLCDDLFRYAFGLLGLFFGSLNV